MKKKFLILCILFSLVISAIPVIAQIECGTPETCDVPQLVERGGYLKPERTDKSNGNPSPLEATLKMLFVFVQFQGESGEDGDWPKGGPPDYLNNLFAENKVQTGNYWERYNRENQFFSDYYMEVSRGTLDVTGVTVNIILDHTAAEYLSDYGGYNGILNEIYYKLVQQYPANFWLTLDKWQRNNSNGLFVYEPETYIDMIGIFFRTVPITGLIKYDGSAGYAGLEGPNYNFPNGKLVGNSVNQYGSGFVCRGFADGPNVKMRNIGIAIHEMGHYLFGPGHSSSGIMTARGGLSINDLFYSGFERMKLGYVEANTVNYNFSTYQLEDVSGREGTANLMMEIPIPPYDGFFLIENRRKISEYDIYMLGDTAGFDTFIDAGEKGKGVYIYHSMTGMSYPSNIDNECADGLWNWTNLGKITADWSPTQPVDLIVRTSIPDPVQNDMSIWNDNNTNKDGVSAKQIFFTWGKRHTQVGQLGTILKYTNTPDWYTSRETCGDRFDAWNLGYNEVFSPYSNPNTKDAYHSPTGIFIYYDGLINNKANINIYKVGEPVENPMSLDNILALTPPSKPMGIKMEEYYEPYPSTICHPKIVWEHNKEPDMINPDNENKLTYKVFRAYTSDMNIIPNDYLEIATVSYVFAETPYYTDISINKYDCSIYDRPPYGTPFPVRYYVKALDNDRKLSVQSDFVATQGIIPGQGIDPGDGDNLKNPVPKIFNLSQNYPNPFNPITNIKYDLPKDVFVSIKIYDLLGREIKILVNEQKKAGSFLVSFNGSEFASGIYFYRIQAGSFVQVRKMVLVK